MRDDEGERGGEAVVAVEGPGLAGLLAEGAIEAFEEAGGAEEARLPSIAAFARPGQRVEVGEGCPKAALQAGDRRRLTGLPGGAERLAPALGFGAIGGVPDRAGVAERAGLRSTPHPGRKSAIPRTLPLCHGWLSGLGSGPDRWLCDRRATLEHNPSIGVPTVVVRRRGAE